MLTANRLFIPIHFAGQEFLLLASGACFWPLKKILIVSDLHLEKGSFFAMRGFPLPLADTCDTLSRLYDDLIKWRPDRVICLGDNVHDANALKRMTPPDLAALKNLCNQVSDWCWVIGNHDTFNIQDTPLSNMQFYDELLIEDICFTHEPLPHRAIQIIGHYHPKISVRKQGAKITGKCFSITKETLIMPAFGTYTGGLDISEKAYKDVLTSKSQFYILVKNQIYLAQ